MRPAGRSPGEAAPYSALLPLRSRSSRAPAFFHHCYAKAARRHQGHERHTPARRGRRKGPEASRKPKRGDGARANQFPDTSPTPPPATSEAFWETDEAARFRKNASSPHFRRNCRSRKNRLKGHFRHKAPVSRKPASRTPVTKTPFSQKVADQAFSAKSPGVRKTAQPGVCYRMRKTGRPATFRKTRDLSKKRRAQHFLQTSQNHQPGRFPENVRPAAFSQNPSTPPKLPKQAFSANSAKMSERAVFRKTRQLRPGRSSARNRSTRHLLQTPQNVRPAGFSQNPSTPPKPPNPAFSANSAGTPLPHKTARCSIPVRQAVFAQNRRTGPKSHFPQTPANCAKH